MTDKPKSDSRKRMRTTPRGGHESQPPESKSSSPTQFPGKAETASFMPADKKKTSPPPQTETPDQALPMPTLVYPPFPSEVPKHRRFNFGPPFWTITGTLSLIVNVILIAILLGLFLNLRSLNLTSVMNMSPSLLGGLYSNFEKMDRAHIKTSIPISVEIPVKFDVQIIQQTEVVLSQDVAINGARVTLITDGLNITSAPANIILPAGTRLPILLNMTVPVDKVIPVSLIVPVDFVLKDTDLHEPVQGLLDVIKPLYCLAVPDAVNLDGQAICIPTQ